MAYNNAFPTTYQPMAYNSSPMPQQMPQMQPNQSQNQSVQNSPMIWVQGETGAKSYLLAPNTTLPLWDSENQTIYLKSADASGMPSMKILDYNIRDNNPPQTPVAMEEPKADFVTHDEFKKFERDIKAQIRNINKKEAKSNE